MNDFTVARGRLGAERRSLVNDENVAPGLAQSPGDCESYNARADNNALNVVHLSSALLTFLNRNGSEGSNAKECKTKLQIPNIQSLMQ
jgi:hypothetical protein